MRRPALNRRQLLTAIVLGGTIGVATDAAEAATGGLDFFSESPASQINSYAAFADAQPARLGGHAVLWSGPAATQRVALTFDDGPTPEFTPRILAVLAAHGVRATFNVMGHNVRLHPGLLRDVAAAGHEVGNHTLNHLNLAAANPDTTRTELLAAQDAIEQVIQRRTTLFRPPHGQLTGALLRTAADLGLTTVLWSVDRLVPGVGTPERVRDAMSTTIQAGDIVCLHDGLGHAGFRPHSAAATALRSRREVEIAALPAVLTGLSARGLHVGSVGDLQAAMRTVAPAVLGHETADRRSSRNR